jgi:hypothetical protein
MKETSRSWWVRWHDDYDDPTSDLSQRLAVVQRRLREAIDAMQTGPITLISVCAGQGRDVIGALTGHARSPDVHALLVEFDAQNIQIAREGVAAEGLTRVEVLQADAALTGIYRGAVPADVLLLCGIFGNVSDADVRRIIVNASRLCSPGAMVLWTRHRDDHDLTPTIRAWFRDAGYEEVAFDSPGPDRFAVGMQRLVSDPLPYRDDIRLFRFVEP